MTVNFLGFCKNDVNHDVYLLVEAFDCPKDLSQTGKKAGEAKFAIYPRSNAPRVNVHAKPGENLYKASDVLTLFRTVGMAEIEMHCGRVQYTTFLREYIPEPQDVDDEEIPTTSRVTPTGETTARTDPRITRSRIETPLEAADEDMKDVFPKTPDLPVLDPNDKVVLEF